MSRLPRVHLPTLTGRLRTDRGLLLLMGLVATLTVALTASVSPATVRTADRAVAAVVQGAGPRGAVVATLPEWYDDPRGKTLDPSTATQVRQDTDYALSVVPPGLAGVLRPGVTSVITPALQLLDGSTGHFLQLVYVDTGGTEPAVTYSEGGPPRASASGPQDDGGLAAEPWPVQVAVSVQAADALGLDVGDRLQAKDEFNRALTVQVSGTYLPVEEDAEAWQASPRLLHPVQGISLGLPFTTAAALVPAASLPDLRFALPGDDLTRRVVFMPEPREVRWRAAPGLERSVVSLQSSAGLPTGDITWDSQLGSVLQQGRAQVASARGQAQVLVVGLVSCALLVLVLAAQLLVARRSAGLAMVRQRGGSLAAIAVELLLEALLVAGLATAVGLGAVRVLLGSAGWGWSVPVLVVATTAAPVLGAATAAARASARRAPANRAARRTAARARRLRRLAVEATVLAVAVLSCTALVQRGVVDPAGDGGDLTAASAPTWAAVAGALLLVRLLPVLVGWCLGLARRSTGSVGLVATARLTETVSRVVPVVVTVVAMAGITVGLAMTATVRQGQADSALSAVGADARLDAEAAADLTSTAARLEDAPGVRAAAAGLVEDGVRLSSGRGVDVVRLVVVDPDAYGRLLRASGLGDAPDLARLPTDDAGPVPALVRGLEGELRGDVTLAWGDLDIPLVAVGVAPDVDDSTDPVVVVDAAAFAAAGAVAPPDTVWAVGAGAGDALEAAARDVDAVDSVERYSDELAQRRDAPLPSALVALAVVSAGVLLALAILAAVLAAVAGAEARGQSLGRLRALGLPRRDVRRLLVVELTAPVAVAALVGLALGVAGSYALLDHLSLELVTGQAGPPSLVVPWWGAVAALLLVGAVLVVASVELRAVRRQALARLLRT